MNKNNLYRTVLSHTGIHKQMLLWGINFIAASTLFLFPHFSLGTLLTHTSQSWLSNSAPAERWACLLHDQSFSPCAPLLLMLAPFPSSKFFLISSYIFQPHLCFKSHSDWWVSVVIILLLTQPLPVTCAWLLITYRWICTILKPFPHLDSFSPVTFNTLTLPCNYCGCVPPTLNLCSCLGMLRSCF